MKTKLYYSSSLNMPPGLESKAPLDAVRINSTSPITGHPPEYEAEKYNAEDLGTATTFYAHIIAAVAELEGHENGILNNTDNSYATLPLSKQEENPSAPHIKADSLNFQQSFATNKSPIVANLKGNGQSCHPSGSQPTSRTGSNAAALQDLDPPLTGDEIVVFYEEQNEDGFTDATVSRALKSTSLRPELAVELLHEWARGNATPYRRGIWTCEDDVMLRNGNVFDIANLTSKHTLGSWGGVAERNKFLQVYDSR